MEVVLASLTAEDLAELGAELGLIVVEDSLSGLVGLAQAILDEHYPADLFGGGPEADPGVRFVAKLREALALVSRGAPEEAGP